MILFWRGRGVMSGWDWFKDTLRVIFQNKCLVLWCLVCVKGECCFIQSVHIYFSYLGHSTWKKPTICKWTFLKCFPIFSLLPTEFTFSCIGWGILKQQIFAGTRWRVLNHRNKTWNLKIHDLPLYLQWGRRDRPGWGGGVTNSTLGQGLVWGLVVTLTPWRSSLCWWWVLLWTLSAPATTGPGLCCWPSAQQTCRGGERGSATHLINDFK